MTRYKFKIGDFICPVPLESDIPSNFSCFTDMSLLGVVVGYEEDNIMEYCLVKWIRANKEYSSYLKGPYVRHFVYSIEERMKLYRE